MSSKSSTNQKRKQGDTYGHCDNLQQFSLNPTETISEPPDESALSVQEASKSHDQIAPRVQKTTQWTHQQHTQNNIHVGVPSGNNQANAVPPKNITTATL